MLHCTARIAGFIIRNGGGDALAAVLAAINSWRSSDHRHSARHARYPREGRLYV